MKNVQMKTAISSIWLIFPCLGMAETTYEAGIGPAIAHFSYKEPSVMQDQGTLYGIQGYVATYDSWMRRVEASYVEGTVDYTSNESGDMSDISDYIFEVRGLLGLNMFYSNGLMTPYSGLGYRYLNDDSSYRQTTTGHWGYEREQSYLYLPLGAMIRLANGPILIEWQLEYDYLLEGRNQSHLSTVPGYSDISVTQNDGYGARASLSLRHTVNLGSITEISVSPYITYWNIKKSSVNSGYYEPQNNSTEYGASLSVHF
ncbi:hypothetical protein [Vibrio mangrovi]|uniref:Outer membrane protein beta-barrel domain-containing protein n=1 Tax=Vibrio mangrovi TaxID=474394 RepID=A0A1Y6IMP7_9VIBR|nr:hypothetical protein [Vibrio mangrovi]MDW6004262.1 hypothetical protein [Vibrio mangrovi]SMR98939.1 hypothetical protein VIM7927_00155 [Vibrio mangrovi]